MDTDIVELLKGAGASTNTAINKELLEAAKDGNLETVRTLLDKGADVNAKSTDTRTCCINGGFLRGDTDIVKLLIDKGADVNAKTHKGATALM